MDGAVRDRARELLSGRGGRVTRQRQAVLEALLDAGRPLAHQELDRALGGRCDRVTLYRVLRYLEEQGLVHRVTDADRVWRYGVGADPAAPPHGHPHFRCLSCGRLECLADVDLPPVRLPRGYRGEGVEMVVTGRCRDCG